MIAKQTNVVTLGQTAPAANYIVIDIETGNAPEQSILDAMAAWKAPSNWKPETVEAKRAEAAEKIRDKAALLDSSPVTCIGAHSDREAVMFYVSQCEPFEIAGWRVVASDTEGGMLARFSGWLGGCTDTSTVLAGHGVRGFDLPKLRGAFVRNRLSLPECLKPRESGPSNPVTDTMHLFKHFSMEHRDNPFVSLDTVASAFGVPRPKSVISGAEAPNLHAAGRIAELCTYCAVDVETTHAIYRLMMS